MAHNRLSGIVQSIRQGSALLLGAGLVTVSLGISMAAEGRDYYRWTDANGVQHFTDKPPSGTKAERVSSGTRPPPALLEEQEARAKEREKQAKEQAAKATRTEQNAERCQVERERLVTLQSNRQIRMRDDQGNLRDLTPADLEAEIAQTQRAISELCP